MPPDLIDRVNALHQPLNDARFNELKHYRRNHRLYPVTATVNCVIGCFLSNNLPAMKLLIERCRRELDGQPPSTDALRQDYLDLVGSYLKAVEAWLGNVG